MGTGKSKGPVKEIATLRKFLHKNQDQRFTDKGVSRLFDTIQIYVHKDDGNAPAVDNDLKAELLEDALKMPFTVFSTKQKKSMIKWLEMTRSATSHSPDGTRRPWWMLRPVRPERKAYDLPEREPVGA